MRQGMTCRRGEPAKPVLPPGTRGDGRHQRVPSFRNEVHATGIAWRIPARAKPVMNAVHATGERKNLRRVAAWSRPSEIKRSFIGMLAEQEPNLPTESKCRFQLALPPKRMHLGSSSSLLVNGTAH